MSRCNSQSDTGTLRDSPAGSKFWTNVPDALVTQMGHINNSLWSRIGFRSLDSRRSKSCTWTVLDLFGQQEPVLLIDVSTSTYTGTWYRYTGVRAAPGRLWYGQQEPLMVLNVSTPVLRIRMFLGIPDTDPDPLVWGTVRIRILLSSSKNSKKNLDPTVLWLLYDILSLKNDVNVASESNIFCCHLEGHWRK
jgi:hypothetical protein